MPFILGRRALATMVGAVALFASPSITFAQSGATMTTQEKQVVDLLKTFETGETAPASVINPDLYIQHNLAAPDGLAGFQGLVASIPPGYAKMNTVRAFQDGDYVFTQSIGQFGADTTVFIDIFRFADGKIVEHWDNLQPAAAANPSGHTMIDGPTEAVDLDKTEANKALVRGYVEDILVNRKWDTMPTYYNGDSLIQHNPMLGDNASSLQPAFEGAAKAGTPVTYDKIHHVLGDGNFVLVTSEGSFGSTPTAFYDLFRVENGKIAEHWDVLETIPPKADWKNQNGKF